MTQAQIATFLNVNHITVSKWERDKSEPNPYQVALLHAFNSALYKDNNIGTKAVRAYAEHGLANALFKLLSADNGYSGEYPVEGKGEQR